MPLCAYPRIVHCGRLKCLPTSGVGGGPPAARGVYKGRKSIIKVEEIKRLLKEGLGATEVARRLGIGRASVYRLAGTAV
jgi:DNA invertase Pin-like site-specific DNA recombinase